MRSGGVDIVPFVPQRLAKLGASGGWIELDLLRFEQLAITHWLLPSDLLLRVVRIPD